MFYSQYLIQLIINAPIVGLNFTWFTAWYITCIIFPSAEIFKHNTYFALLPSSLPQKIKLYKGHNIFQSLGNMSYGSYSGNRPNKSSCTKDQQNLIKTSQLAYCFLHSYVILFNKLILCTLRSNLDDNTILCIIYLFVISLIK